MKSGLAMYNSGLTTQALQVFRVEFQHKDTAPGIVSKQPDIRFVLAPDEIFVRTWADNIKWMWGEHSYEVNCLGSVDMIIEVASQ